ncbi:MAG: glycosyltransferase [Planctomycetota bacterium]|nr:glycosyltransferase [Planctomycetota bacterium]
MQRPSLLLVAWYFPPDGGAGSQRPASFARHLPDLGWETTVLTRSSDHPRSRYEPRDDGLLESIGDASRLIRVEERAPLELPHGGVERTIASSCGPFCSSIEHTCERLDPDVVLITMSPFITASVLPALRKLGRARIVLDLRDPWALDPWPDRPFWRQPGELRRMREALDLVDGVVLNTPESLLRIRRVLGPGLALDLERRAIVVTNGFTASDFSGPAPGPSEPLEIIHCGTFLCEHASSQRTPVRRVVDRLRRIGQPRLDRSGRTPEHLLAAAGLLRRTDPSIHERLRFHFIGQADDRLRDCVARSPCPEQVELRGYLEHSRMVERLRTASALFLPCGALPPSSRELIVPGKTYEYLASGRPILAALPPGDALDLVSSMPGCYPCVPNSPESSAESIRELDRDLSAGALDGLADRRANGLAPYERGHLAERLSGFLNRILALPATCDS